MKDVITRLNYEAFLIDYLEGTLDENLKSSVENFLLENPDIKQEFDGLSASFIITEDVIFDNKDSLKKATDDIIPSHFKNSDEFLLAKLEGDLNEDEKNQYEKLVNAIPALKKEYQIFEKTILKPDLSVIYKYKSQLKRSIIPVFSIDSLKRITYYSAAAILIITLLLVNRKLFTPESSNEIAQKTFNEKNNDVIERTGTHSENNELQLNNDNKVQLATLTVKPENKYLIIKDDSQKVVENTDSIEKKEIINKTVIAALESDKEIQAGILDYETDNVSSGQVYTIDQYLMRQFRKKVLKESREEYNSRKFSGWDLVDAGLRQTGKIFGQNWQLKKDYNENGKIENLAFNSRLLSFDYPIRK